MNIIDKVSMNVDFQENEVMPLLHRALQLFRSKRVCSNTCFA